MEYKVNECKVKNENVKDEDQASGMFAAVWVKIEPDESDDNEEADEETHYNNEDTEEDLPLTNSLKKKLPEKRRNNAVLKCSLCDYSTRFKNSLMLHVLRHSARPLRSDLAPEDHGSNDGANEEIVDTDENGGKQSSLKNDEEKQPEKGRKSKVLQCTLCDYSTTYKNSLMLHMLRHSATKPFACDMCEYTTKYPGALQRHKNIKHPSNDEDQGSGVVDPNAAYKCDQCTFATALKWNLKSHKRKHMSEKRYKCAECNYGTAYRHNLIKHQRQHSNSLFKCDKCAFTTKFEGHIYRHMSKIHNELMFEGHKCPYCDFCTIVKWRLNIHIQRSKQAEPVKCVFCGFETMYSCESKRHKRDHFNETHDGEMDGDASLGSGLNSSDALDEVNIHEPIVSVEAEPAAESVESGYGEGAQRAQHYTVDCRWVEWKNIQVLETNEGERTFRCHLCPYASKFKATVQRHFQRRHTDKQVRPYKCNNCDFATKTKDQIALHNKRSQVHQTMHCPKCPFTTVFKCQLVMHQKIHNVFKCKSCDYSSKNKYDLDTHISTQHLGKYFKCKFCEYKAARRDSLMSHEATHTGNKPLKCPHCDYRTVRNCFLMTHLTKKHTDVLKRSCEKRSLQPASRPVVSDAKGSEHKVVSFEDISTIIDNIKNNLCRVKSKLLTEN